MNFLRHLNWKWKALGSFAGVVVVVWMGLGIYAKHGLHTFLREFRKNPDYESPAFWLVGPSTRDELKELTDSKYSISVRPLDWVGSGQFVTHTAFLTTASKTLKLRLRFSPLDRCFHIVGFANEQK